MPKSTLALLACTLLCTQALAQQKGTFTDVRDGKTYKTVKIGEQVWMGENLNYNRSGFLNYGSRVSKCYNDSTVNCDHYGRLYNWETAMNVCPKGWHLPSEEEWKVLTATVGGDTIAGKYLKSVYSALLGGWDKNGYGEDKFGFSALPSGIGRGRSCSYIICFFSALNLPNGIGYSEEEFDNIGDYGYWWSATEDNSTHACGMSIGYDFNGVEYGCYKGKDFLFSVRCLQNTPTIPTGTTK